jgi:uncharacterized protein involved in exopolysaccharide biosynthesis
MSRQSITAPTPVKSGRSGFTFRQLCFVLWAHRVSIAMVVGGAVAATRIAGRLSPKAFQGTATVLVAFQMEAPSAGEFPAHLAQTYIRRQTDAIRSRQVLSKAVEKLDLAAVPEFMTDYHGADDAETRTAWATLQLGERVAVEQGEDRFIYISAEDADPTRAADLANAVAESFVEYQQRLNIEPDRERAAQFDEGIERLRLRVEDAQAKVTAYAAAHGGHVGTGGEDSARAMDLDRRLFEARARRQQADLRLRGLGKDDASMPGAQQIHSLQNQLAEKQAALKKLQPLLGENDPQYRSFQTEITQTRAKLYEVIVAYQQGLRDDAVAARAIEQKLEQERQQQSGTASDASYADGEGGALMRDLNAAIQAYQAALDNVDVARLGAGLPTSSASVVTRAVPPLAHAHPRVESNLLLALVISLLVAVILVLLRELFDRRIRCAADFERNLGVPVLAELGTRGGA